MDLNEIFTVATITGWHRIADGFDRIWDETSEQVEFLHGLNNKTGVVQFESFNSEQLV